MKKVMFSVAAILMLAATSCKKDYTCKCTTTYAGLTASASTTIHDTKSNATDACDKGDASTTVAGVSSSTACEIE